MGNLWQKREEETRVEPDAAKNLVTICSFLLPEEVACSVLLVSKLWRESFSLSIIWQHYHKLYLEPPNGILREMHRLSRGFHQGVSVTYQRIAQPSGSPPQYGLARNPIYQQILSYLAQAGKELKEAQHFRQSRLLRQQNLLGPQMPNPDDSAGDVLECLIKRSQDMQKDFKRWQYRLVLANLQESNDLIKTIL